MKVSRTVFLIAVASSIATTPLSADQLSGYNASIAESSISGISSGGYMAVQFGTAWSSIIKGVGVVAGGPFWCAKADAYDFMTGYSAPIMRATGACTKGPASDLDISEFITKTDAQAASGKIDPLENLREQRIYLFHGYNDAVVGRPVTDATAQFYRHYLGDAKRSNLFYQTTVGAGHSLVVGQMQLATSLNACDANDSPYIDQCDYDQAGVILQHIYGILSPPNRNQLSGKLKQFEQSFYTRPKAPEALSLGDTGYVFVPEECERGESCRVHVALHGCRQDPGNIGKTFVENAGYNAWADTNRLIVLYPQTRSSSFAPYNPLACWDWWSYVDHTDNYVTKAGAQIRSIKAMIDALTSGVGPRQQAVGTAAPAPALAVIDTSDNAVGIAFAPMEGTVVHRLSRAGPDGDFAVVGETTGPSFADVGLTPQSTYRWRVSPVVNGVEGATSGEVMATTRPTPKPCPVPGRCPIVR